jgi:hypothetical protein
MATLWIREYSETASAGSPRSAGSGKAQVAQEPGTDQTPVTFTTTTQSAAFANSTTYICIVGSAAFHYVVGTNPTATTNALKIAADTPIYIGVQPGHKIAVVTA